MPKVQKNNFFVGLDLAYAKSGLVVIDDHLEIFEQKLILTDSKWQTEKRFNKILEEIHFIKDIVRLKMVNMEGLALGINNKASSSFSELCGAHYLVRMFFYQNNIPFIITPPKSLKLYITEDGAASKQLMMDCVFSKYGKNITCHDIADAYGLGVMAVDSIKK